MLFVSCRVPGAVPHTPILRVGLEPNPYVILSAAKNPSSIFPNDEAHRCEDVTALFPLAAYSRVNPFRSLVMVKLPSARTDIFRLCP